MNAQDVDYEWLIKEICTKEEPEFFHASLVVKIKMLLNLDNSEESKAKIHEIIKIICELDEIVKSEFAYDVFRRRIYFGCSWI